MAFLQLLNIIQHMTGQYQVWSGPSVPAVGAHVHILYSGNPLQAFLYALHAHLNWGQLHCQYLKCS